MLKFVTTFGASNHSLQGLGLFAGVEDTGLAAILAECPVLRANAGQPVFEPNSPGARMYVVLRGALGVAEDLQAVLSGGTVTKVLPGESVGELAALDGEVNSLAVAALQETDLLEIEAARLWQAVEQTPALARNMLRLLAFRLRAANAQLRRRQKVGEFFRQLSLNDGLTGLYNRAWLNDLLPTLAKNANTEHSDLSIIMVDLDHFKRFNDSHGHQAGDDALRAAANVLKHGSRPAEDFVARYGGEEMMVILPDANRELALKVAQRLCEKMRQTSVFPDMRQPLPHITASFGVASLAPGQSESDLVAAADAALYRAKEKGRDRVEG